MRLGQMELLYFCRGSLYHLKTKTIWVSNVAIDIQIQSPAPKAGCEIYSWTGRTYSIPVGVLLLPETKAIWVLQSSDRSLDSWSCPEQDTRYTAGPDEITLFLSGFPSCPEAKTIWVLLCSEMLRFIALPQSRMRDTRLSGPDEVTPFLSGFPSCPGGRTIWALTCRPEVKNQTALPMVGGMVI